MGVLNTPNSRRGNPNQPVYLLTERGYLLLVKTFDDDLAWQVQEQLVEAYFRVRQHPPAIDEEALAERITAKVIAAVNASRQVVAPTAECPQPMGPRVTIAERLRMLGWQHTTARQREDVRKKVADLLVMHCPDGWKDPTPLCGHNTYSGPQIEWLDEAIRIVKAKYAARERGGLWEGVA